MPLQSIYRAFLSTSRDVQTHCPTLQNILLVNDNDNNNNNDDDDDDMAEPGEYTCRVSLRLDRDPRTLHRLPRVVEQFAAATPERKLIPSPPL